MSSALADTVVYLAKYQSFKPYIPNWMTISESQIQRKKNLIKKLRCDNIEAHCGKTYIYIQSTLVISNSLILNNRLSRSENLVPVLIQRSTNRQQNIVEKRRNCSLGAISPLFHNIFNISLT